MARESHSGRKIALGALIAGAAGYLAGILTAPKSGKDTREDISTKAEDVKYETEQQLQNLHDELDNLLNTTKNKTLALGSKARAEFDEAVVGAKDAKNKTTVLLKSIKAGEAGDPELNKAIKQAKAAIKNLGKYYKS